MGERVERCAECGKEHPRSALELSFKRPDAVVALSKAEREARCKESNDLCSMDGERFFVRGVLPLPVAGRQEPYCIGLWAEISAQAYERIWKLWDEPDQSSEPAFQATLANDVPGGATLGLRVKVALTGPTTRPDLFVVEVSHPLFEEQRAGISSHRAYEYSSLF
jgi:hypothetical protein